MNSPRLLFLDEPSTGMDPQNRANLWAHIRSAPRPSGTTIVLTTHYLEEADAEAERVVVIDHGEIIADDTAANLKAGWPGTGSPSTVDGRRGRARPGRLGAARAASSRRSATRSGWRSAAGSTRAADVAGRAARAGRDGVAGAGRRCPGADAGRRVLESDRAQSARGRGGGGMTSAVATRSRAPVARVAGHLVGDCRGVPARDVAGAARPVLVDLLPGPAAGVPGAVRPAAGRLGRSGGARRANRRCSGSCPG